MASTVKGYAQSANVAAASPANGEQKVYIGRRTGAVIKINARKDSHGFERIEDYFPDSESEDENKSLYDAKPVKLKPNQYIGRRTGALIEINARKDSHGFELIEDYFPDSIRESDVSTVSNKGEL
ncbi:uncharacterized protein LOC116308354 [Actinia tenebrosa]|uniref:Uncharacterized protein LOC116308354 n=1 Tax=Actinia tenebrosa TaxID=6105 RepID=A0A6P8JA50_ACTTE|nr:uncharacterized protein LOC116308354 [Actinia tenebrosa]